MDTKVITDYYAKNPNREWTRLERHPFEFPITFRHINGLLGNNKMSIADIGGGPGRYSIELARNGHEVTLIDLTPENIEFARVKSKELNVEIKEFLVGDARQLPMFPNEHFDLTLLLGPLYHLLDNEDRTKAIQEALRVTKKNGYIFLGFISRYAPIYDLIKKIPEENYMTIEQLKSIYNKMTNQNVFEDNGFNDAHFIDPNEIDCLLSNFNVEIIKKFGAESIFAQSDNKLHVMEEVEKVKWIDFGFELSEHQAGILGSEHIICVVKKIS